ncbi:MAG: hypothetical protein NZ455_15425 [Bacteroidia bacterium]|nr:hypothetical protein [Bacteroidia bacterium]MDW8347876.1 hypothetical protein [Bacteroidia bacterium]
MGVSLWAGAQRGTRPKKYNQTKVLFYLFDLIITQQLQILLNYEADLHYIHA